MIFMMGKILKKSTNFIHDTNQEITKRLSLNLKYGIFYAKVMINFKLIIPSTYSVVGYKYFALPLKMGVCC